MRETLDELVARYLRDGDEEAADEVVRRTRKRLLAAARRIGSPQDAEDAVHAAYLSLLHKRGGGLDAPVLPWLLTAVVRIAYRHKAKERRQSELTRRLARAPTAPGTAVAAARREEFARVRASVDRLPSKYRDVVVLHYLQGLTTGEVATLLEVSPAAVKKRLQRARALMLGSLAPWIALPLLALPWLLADLARGSGATVITLTGGAMQAKTAAILVTVTVAAGSAGFGAALATGAAGDPAPARADSAAARAESIASLELVEQVARLEERARMLEEENDALRDGRERESPDRGTVPATAGESSATTVELEVGRYAARKSALDEVTAGRKASDQAPSDLVEAWRARLQERITATEMRRAGEVLRQSGDTEGVEKTLRESLAKVDEASEEGRAGLMELGHLERGKRDYVESDSAYERIRNVVDPSHEQYAEATFQLAWNRRFAGELDEAQRLFDESSRLPGASRSVAAIARYNVAQLEEKAGRTAEAQAEYEAILREFGEDENGNVQYYMKLVRQRLDAPPSPR